MMSNVMPSQVIQTIDELFPHAKSGGGDGPLEPDSHGTQLRGILSLIKAIPDNLLALSPSDYAEFALATSTVETHLERWVVQGGVVGRIPNVKGRDVVTVLRHVLVKCSDEHPPASTTELLFIKDDELRENIRRDIGATNRALNNAEWKAATVLAGAAIEALLHWRLQEPSPGELAIQSAIQKLVAECTLRKPNANRDFWGLDEFIKVARKLNLIKPDTAIAAGLAQNYRNLIHPGRAQRLAQTCHRGTAHSAVGALEHVIRDLS
jgi:hypothetical protein